MFHNWANRLLIVSFRMFCYTIFTIIWRHKLHTWSVSSNWLKKIKLREIKFKEIRDYVLWIYFRMQMLLLSQSPKKHLVVKFHHLTRHPQLQAKLVVWYLVTSYIQALKLHYAKLNLLDFSLRLITQLATFKCI